MAEQVVVGVDGSPTSDPAPVRSIRTPGSQLTIRTDPSKQTRALTAQAAPLLEGYSQPLRRLEPRAPTGRNHPQAGEIDALATLVRRLPQLADAMDHQVIPLLDHLDQLGPDLNHLLDSVSQLNHMANRLPKVFQRRNHPDP